MTGLRPEIGDPQSVLSASRESASSAAVQDIGRGINFYDQDPPYDRDRNLPQATYGPPPETEFED